MTESRYRSLVRIVAIIDLFACIGFATPWTFNIIQYLLGLVAPLPAFEPLHLLFVYLMGTLTVTWAIIRIVKPESWLGLTDALARCVFGAWEIFFLLSAGINPAVWLFAGLEIIPAIGMFVFYFRRTPHFVA